MLDDILGAGRVLRNILVAGSLALPLVAGCEKKEGSQGYSIPAQGLVQRAYPEVGLGVEKTPEDLRGIAYAEAKNHSENPQLTHIVSEKCHLVKSDSGKMFYNIPAWLFCYNAGGKNIVVRATEDGEAAFNPEDASRFSSNKGAIEDWVVSLDEAVHLAIEHKAMGGLGLFSLDSADINGKQTPVWKTPYKIQEGGLLRINALTGELIGAKSLPEPRTGNIGYGRLRDGIIEVNAEEMKKGPNIYPSPADHIWEVKYSIKNISKKEVPVEMIEAFLFYKTKPLLNSTTIKSGPGKQVEVLAPGQTTSYTANTAGRDFPSLDKIQLAISIGGERHLFVDYLTKVREDLLKNKE